jgi:hypothetical protein
VKVANLSPFLDTSSPISGKGNSPNNVPPEKSKHLPIASKANRFLLLLPSGSLLHLLLHNWTYPDTENPMSEKIWLMDFSENL